MSAAARKNSGFTLVEMAIVLIIIGVVISAMVTVLPSLLQSAKIKKAQAILEKTEYALRGKLLSDKTLPWADTDKDGEENTGECFGWLPYKDLGLASGDDVWKMRLRYGVYNYNDSVTTSKICDPGFSAPSNDSSKLHIVAADGSIPPQLFVVISGGDASGGFEGYNAVDDAAYDDPTRTVSYSDGKVVYNDLMIAVDINTAKGSVCPRRDDDNDNDSWHPSENCTNYLDDDGDGAIDCVDTDCASHPHCVNTAKVYVNPLGIPPVVINGTLDPSLIITAVGGESQPSYNWSLENVPAALQGMIAINSSGRLSGALKVCNTVTPYTITIRAEDKYPQATTPVEDTFDEENFEITVIKGVLQISPANTELPDPDFTVNTADFSQLLTLFGDYVGPFTSSAAWSLSWGNGTAGDDPGGFEVVPLSSTTASFRRTSDLSTAGNFVAKITATDDTCPENTVTAAYSVNITDEGAGSSILQGMEAEWRFDECTVWDGVNFDVLDSLNANADNRYNGKASGGVIASHSGKLCRAASFDGANDKIVSKVFTGTDIMVFNDSVTLAVWFKSPGGGGANPRLFEFSDALGSYSWSTALVYDADGSMRAWVTDALTGVRGGEIDFSTTLYNDNKWHHAVYTYKGANGGKLYMDGVLKQTRTDDPASKIHDAETFVIGGYYPDTANGFKGLIDEVRVFSRELSAADVTQIYQASRPACSGACYTEPIAAWNMDESLWDADPATFEVKDSSGNGLDGTAVNGANTTPDGKICRAGSFVKANSQYLDMKDPASGELDPGANHWTIFSWINWDGSTTDNIIYNKENLYEARVSNGNVQYAWQPSWVWSGGTFFPITANTWTNVTVSYDGVNQRLYKDGTEVYSRPQTGAIGVNASKLLLGARGNTSPAYFFGGKIDEMKIYNRTLADNELAALINATNLCPPELVAISTTSLAGGILASPYTATLEAAGGTRPYGWEIVGIAPAIPGLSIVTNVDYTATLQGTLDVCVGNYDVTVRVFDAGGAFDQKSFTLTVANGGLSITPLPGGSPDFSCTTSTCSKDFTISGLSLGAIGNYGLSWLVSPGNDSFELVPLSDNTVRLQKKSSSDTGTFSFKISAQDSSCPANAVTTGYYTVSISGAGAATPYYTGLLAEWRLDECDWSAAGAVTDYSGNNHHGTAQNGAVTVAAGKVCRAGSTMADNSSILLSSPFVDLNASWSIAAWFRKPLASRPGSTRWTLTCGTNNRQILIEKSSGLLGTSNNTGNMNFDSSGFNINTLSDGWHHLVAVGHDAVTDFYIDGVFKGGAGFKSTDDIQTLGNNNVGNQTWGEFDEVLVYSRALSLADINALFTMTAVCPTTDCYAIP